MKWILSSDHAGAQLKKDIQCFLEEKYAYNCQNFGAVSEEDIYDYPDAVDEALSVYKKGDICIFVCGTGLGISMRANRYYYIRAAVIYNLFSAKSAKKHNNANALCFGARTQTFEEVCTYISAFIAEEYEGGRHNKRIDKLTEKID